MKEKSINDIEKKEGISFWGNIKTLFLINILLLIPFLVFSTFVVYALRTRDSRYSNYKFEPDEPLEMPWPEFEVKELNSVEEQFSTIESAYEIIDGTDRFTYKIGGREILSDVKNDMAQFYEAKYEIGENEIIIKEIDDAEYVQENGGEWYKLSEDQSFDIQDYTTMLFILETLGESTQYYPNKFLGDYMGLVDCQSENKCQYFKYPLMGNGEATEYMIELELDAKYLRPVRFKIAEYEFNFTYPINRASVPSGAVKLSKNESEKKVFDICTKLQEEKSYPDAPCIP